MFEYQKHLTLRETDATGAIYFVEQPSIAAEAFQAFLQSRGLNLQQMILEKKFNIPVVRAECDFFAPIFVGDQVKVELTLGEIGNKSFTLLFALKNGSGVEVGKVKIIHAYFDIKTMESAPVPDFLQVHLNAI